MFSAFFVALLGIGHLATGVPLERPSEDLSRYFDSRIVGGAVAAEGRAPHMVGLLVGTGIRSFICGGSLITYNHVCTAAHCTAPFTDWSGALIPSFHGVIDTNQWHTGTFITFTKLEQHREYNPSTYKNDIAIITTYDVRELQTKNIKPIALDYDWVDGEVESFVTGWGNERLWGQTPDDLKILYVNTFDSDKCVEMVNAMSPWGPRVDPKLEICTLHSVGNGMCHGDSGSALVSKHNAKQSGIVAWGYPCAIGGPDVYTRIQPHRHFIESIIHERN